MRILITGTTGLLGSHLACYLLGKGYDVVGIRRESSDLSTFQKIAEVYALPEEQWKKHFTWRIADILDIRKLDKAMDGVDAVIHSAAIVSFLRTDREQMLRVNQDGTANVVNACLAAGVSTLCHVSSTSVFPESDRMVDEAFDFDPDGRHSTYGLTKHLAELEVFRGQEEGLHVSIVNPSVILGYGDWNKGSCKLFRQAKNAFPFYSTGGTGFVGVHDVCQTIGRLLTSPAKGRYLCVSENLSFREIQNQMADSFGVKRPYIKVGRQKAGVLWRLAALLRLLGIKTLITRESAHAANRVQHYDSSRAVQELNVEFTPVADVIKEAVDLYKKNELSGG